MTVISSVPTTWTKETLEALEGKELNAMAKGLEVTTQRRAKADVITDILNKIAIDLPASVTSTMDPALQAKIEELGGKVEVRGGKPFVKIPKTTEAENVEKIGELIEGTAIKAIYDGNKPTRKAASRKSKSKSTLVVGELTRAGAKIVSINEEDKSLVIECSDPGCATHRNIHFQDAFQVRFCTVHAKFNFRKRRSEKNKAVRQEKAATKAAEVIDQVSPTPEQAV